MENKKIGKLPLVLIIIILLFNIFIITWKFAINDKNDNELENNNEKSEVTKIMENKQSKYSISGTWLGWMFGGFTELTINDSNKVTGRFLDDVASKNDYQIVNAEMINSNILKIYNITHGSIIKEFKEISEFYFFAVDENRVVMFPVQNVKITNASVLTKKSSTPGILGTWQYEDGNTIEIIKDNDCNYGISGNCYMTGKSSLEKMEKTYFDDYFSYGNIGQSFEIAGNVDNMYGYMMYYIEENQLFASTGYVLLKK